MWVLSLYTQSPSNGDDILRATASSSMTRPPLRPFSPVWRHGLTAVSEWRLPVLLRSAHPSLNLLIWDKHDNIPGAQPQERRHEPEGGVERMSGTSEACYKLINGNLPFVEGCGAFLSQHGESTVNGTAVLARRGIHEARFDNVHGRRHYSCAEACTEGSSEVARQIVWTKTGNKLSGVLLHFQQQPLTPAVPHLSSGHTWGSAPWSGRRSPARRSLRSHYGWCWEDNLERSNEKYHTVQWVF